MPVPQDRVVKLITRKAIRRIRLLCSISLVDLYKHVAQVCKLAEGNFVIGYKDEGGVQKHILYEPDVLTALSTPAAGTLLLEILEVKPASLQGDPRLQMSSAHTTTTTSPSQSSTSSCLPNSLPSSSLCPTSSSTTFSVAGNTTSSLPSSTSSSITRSSPTLSSVSCAQTFSSPTRHSPTLTSSSSAVISTRPSRFSPPLASSLSSSSSAPSSPSLSAQSWMCPRCTFANHILIPKCEMCDTSKPIPISSSKRSPLVTSILHSSPLISPMLLSASPHFFPSSANLSSSPSRIGIPHHTPPQQQIQHNQQQQQQQSPLRQEEQQQLLPSVDPLEDFILSASSLSLEKNDMSSAQSLTLPRRSSFSSISSSPKTSASSSVDRSALGYTLASVFKPTEQSQVHQQESQLSSPRQQQQQQPEEQVVSSSNPTNSEAASDDFLPADVVLQRKVSGYSEEDEECSPEKWGWDTPPRTRIASASSQAPEVMRMRFAKQEGEQDSDVTEHKEGEESSAISSTVRSSTDLIWRQDREVQRRENERIAKDEEEVVKMVREVESERTKKEAIKKHEQEMKVSREHERQLEEEKLKLEQEKDEALALIAQLKKDQEEMQRVREEAEKAKEEARLIKEEMRKAQEELRRKEAELQERAKEKEKVERMKQEEIERQMAVFEAQQIMERARYEAIEREAAREAARYEAERVERARHEEIEREKIRYEAEGRERMKHEAIERERVRREEERVEQARQEEGAERARQAEVIRTEEAQRVEAAKFVQAKQQEEVQKIAGEQARSESVLKEQKAVNEKAVGSMENMGEIEDVMRREAEQHEDAQADRGGDKSEEKANSELTTSASSSANFDVLHEEMLSLELLDPFAQLSNRLGDATALAREAVQSSTGEVDSRNEQVLGRLESLASVLQDTINELRGLSGSLNASVASIHANMASLTSSQLLPVVRPARVRRQRRGSRQHGFSSDSEEPQEEESVIERVKPRSRRGSLSLSVRGKPLPPSSHFFVPTHMSTSGTSTSSSSSITALTTTTAVVSTSTLTTTHSSFSSLPAAASSSLLLPFPSSASANSSPALKSLSTSLSTSVSLAPSSLETTESSTSVTTSVSSSLVSLSPALATLSVILPPALSIPPVSPSVSHAQVETSLLAAATASTTAVIADTTTTTHTTTTIIHALSSSSMNPSLTSSSAMMTQDVAGALLSSQTMLPATLSTPHLSYSTSLQNALALLDEGPHQVAIADVAQSPVATETDGELGLEDINLDDANVRALLSASTCGELSDAPKMTRGTSAEDSEDLDHITVDGWSMCGVGEGRLPSRNRRVPRMARQDEAKLAQLRAMGFTNRSFNLVLLGNYGGDLAKVITALQNYNK